MCAANPDTIAAMFDKTTESRKIISSFSSGNPRLRCSVTTQDSKTVNKRFVVIPPTVRATTRPMTFRYCSKAFIMISRTQYVTADVLRPNLSTKGPVKGEAKAPAVKPAA